MTKLFSKAGQKYGDIVTKNVNLSEMPDFEDACEMLKDTDSAKFRALHANALKAKKYKKMTYLQEAIITMHADLKAWIEYKEESDSMIHRMSDPGPHFIHNFKKHVVLNLRGIHYETNGGIKTVTLKDCISKKESETKDRKSVV